MSVAPSPGKRLLDRHHGYWEPWWGRDPASFVRLHQYHLGATLAAGGRVLVLGSADGFGSALLASVATTVIAIEADASCVLHARYNYPRDNLLFVHGQPHETMQGVEGSFDLIAALDCKAPPAVLQVIIDGADRLLSHEGVMLISTDADEPDEAVGELGSPAAPVSTDPEPADRFRRASAGLLEAMLRGRFKEVTAWRQTFGSQFDAGDQHSDLAGSDGADVPHHLIMTRRALFAASRASLDRGLDGAAHPRTFDRGALEHPTGQLPVPEAVDGWLDEQSPSTGSPVEQSPDGAAKAAGLAGALAQLEECRLRRQVVAYDAALAHVVADASTARLEAETARSNLEVVEIQLASARSESTLSREAADAARREAEALRAERDELFQQLAEVEASRAVRLARAGRRLLGQTVGVLGPRR